MLTVEHLSRSYGGMVAIKRLDFKIDAGEFVCIVGPSGCGKTTLLKCVAGLLPPTDGRVLLHEQQVLEPPRQMALVFQDYSRSLLPWMSVQANVSLLPHQSFQRKADLGTTFLRACLLGLYLNIRDRERRGGGYRRGHPQKGVSG